MRSSRPSSASRYPSLERFRKDISRCVRCGACRAVCPSFLQERDETFSARGRMALIESVLKGSLTVSEMYRDRLATCAGCLACEGSCPGNVPVTAIIQAAKEEAVRESGPGIISRIVAAALTNDAVMRSLGWLAPIMLRYSGQSVRGKIQGSRVKGQGERRGKEGKTKGTVAFFPGCGISYFQQDIQRAAVRVLNAIGYEVIVPEGLACCGRPLLSLGDRKAAEECAVRNNELFAALGADAVITACASCGLTFKKEYPTLLAPSEQKPVPVQDIHEFLAGKMKGSMLSPLPVKVAYHDPCHLGRGQGLSKTAKSVLLSVPGVELVEMENPDRCCGFGGIMRVSHHGLSDRIGDEKAKDIIATKAPVAVTGCPGCMMQIADSLRRSGSDIEVLHTVQVLEKALGAGPKGDNDAAAGFSPFSWQEYSGRRRGK